MTHDTPSDWGHAIVGCGRIAPYHADAVRHAPPLRLLRVLDTERDVAERFAAGHGAPQVADSLDELLRDAAVRSVSLATPHDEHVRQGLQAVGAGRHVLIEKPPGLDDAAVEELRRSAAEHGVVAMPVAQHRFDPIVGLVRDLLASGDLGPVRMARCHLECVREPEYYAASPWRGSWGREGGSVLMNQAYHFVDMLLWLLGPVRGVAGLFDTLGSPGIMETEDSVVAALRFEAGALGSLAVTGAAGGVWTNAVELVGEQGSVAFDLSSPQRIHRLELRSKRALKAWREALERIPPEPLGVGGTAYYGTSHRAQFQAFVAAVQGRPDPRASTLAQAAGVVRLIRAIYAQGWEAHGAR